MCYNGNIISNRSNSLDGLITWYADVPGFGHVEVEARKNFDAVVKMAEKLGIRQMGTTDDLRTLIYPKRKYPKTPGRKGIW